MNGKGKNEERTSEIHVRQLPTAAVTTATAKVDDKCRVLCARSLNWVSRSQIQSWPCAKVPRKIALLCLFVCSLFLSDSS